MHEMNLFRLHLLTWKRSDSLLKVRRPLEQMSIPSSHIPVPKCCLLCVASVRLYHIDCRLIKKYGLKGTSNIHIIHLLPIREQPISGPFLADISLSLP